MLIVKGNELILPNFENRMNSVQQNIQRHGKPLRGAHNLLKIDAIKIVFSIALAKERMDGLC